MKLANTNSITVADKLRYLSRRMTALLASGATATDKRYIALKAQMDALRSLDPQSPAPA